MSMPGFFCVKKIKPRRYGAMLHIEDKRELTKNRVKDLRVLNPVVLWGCGVKILQVYRYNQACQY